ncbi:16S rRNA (uracil(1498)-N(3))-methyltransferase [Georgenia subflava]|uniref:Ribosomal RNA small subunit methyltransferase E n=1 Tax=Georgenia subflava TaxID=1622177 RepID=A0A6N7EKW7_9MICO|nr:16S rRNA (uracil(1498)-N(3))-methyltransferase [Georgenia subflava]MPV37195.1 16S rRNA (uracil(1498)-N(3))-methyltransferase [Georgenia subflava]
MSTAVFHAGAGVLDDAAPGATVTLRGDEARHAAVVMRLRAGERVDLVDGAGLRVSGTVSAAAKDELTVAVESRAQELAPAVRLVLVQALAKGGRDEQAVETATELGVDAVVPWQAARSVSVWSGPKLERGRQRWSAVALAAAKQSRRSWVPAVREPVRTSGLAADVAATVAAGGAVLVLHEQAAVPLAAARLPGPGAADADASGASDVVVVVGPEGGITDEEVAALTDAGGQPVLVGPHVLRTSTAGPAALAVLAQRLGRWG